MSWINRKGTRAAMDKVLTWTEKRKKNEHDINNSIKTSKCLESLFRV